MSAFAERLHLLHEHIRLSLLERKHVLESDAEPNNRTVHDISQSLDTLHQGIEQLEREQSRLETEGELSFETLRERQDELSRLRLKTSDLQTQFSTETAPNPADTGELLINLGQRTGNSLHESTAREALIRSPQSPGSLQKSNKTVRFRDSLEDAEEIENHRVLRLHQRVMEQQDDSLDRLSTSIRNQRELSIQIGDELEDHVRLLVDVDYLVDRHQTRLDGARRKLNRVAQSTKENGSLVIIIILIIILLLLVVILK
ncbi:hypothetical protein K440DRAFT_547429 [Wilcoxina mikolae CBS 423.85]|nr:hypothetical protein K440DRAFT_547429 [Wilcoxina mikolae CBS 423.85]